jgi:hypothetical protein
MVSIVRVYNIVRDLANKDQKGFIAPNVFTSFARVAQQNIYNEMFNEMKLATALRKSGRDSGRDKSAYKMVEEDLSTYINNMLITTDIDAYADEAPDPNDPDQTITVNVNPDGAFTFRRPSDFGHLISMQLEGTNTSVELIYDSEKLNRVLNSNLSTPTLEFPVALEMNEVFQVFPTDVTGVVMRYYRQPQSRAEAAVQLNTLDAAGVAFAVNYGLGEYIPNSQPTFVANTVDDGTGFIIPNLNSSRGFDLPAHYIHEVVMEICQLIGVRLRDNVLMQYGMMETQAE